jgi:hypothetical protein
VRYLNYTKSVITSFLFISPFFFLYEFIAFFKFQNQSYQIRNTADIIIRDFFGLFTDNVMLLYTISLLIIFTFIFISNYKKIKEYTFNLKYISVMYLEGLLWGFVLVLFLNGFNYFDFIDGAIIVEDYLLSFYFCVGAGIWEELLFRLICINCMMIIFKYLNIPLFISICISIIISSIFFSLFHYIGSMGDVFTIFSFIYRFLGGVYLSILYYYRGIGISMMSHFIYDFLLITLPVL